MKHILLITLLAGLMLAAPNPVRAQTNTADAAATAAADKEKATVEKHIKLELASLKLTDPDQAAKVHDLLAARYTALKAWHETNDAQLKTLWGNFDQARKAKNAAAANAALDQISGVYAAIQPQHEKFVADLAALLTPEQVEALKDAHSINKVKVTYDVYLQIFPKLTDEQKAVVLKNLKAAREESLDCVAIPDMSALFKKYKIKIEEEYFVAQGIDAPQARKDFAAKQKADQAAKTDPAQKNSGVVPLTNY
ncbi:MAG: DUF3826 domain-containing protein [Verrucomicrobiae bacterium]|nr:DUF3826 domain-containing protein [Verrucomicrobiae bacterium]